MCFYFSQKNYTEKGKLSNQKQHPKPAVSGSKLNLSGDPNDKVMVTEDKAMYGQMYGQSLLLKKETVISNSGANTQTNVSGMDLKLG